MLSLLLTTSKQPPVSSIRIMTGLNSSISSDLVNPKIVDGDTRPSKRRSLSASGSSSAPSEGPKEPSNKISRIKPRLKTQPPQTANLQETEISNGKIVDAKSSFATINVAPWLIASLAAMAIRRPTAIQKSCIPEILNGKDVIGGGKTGSGKTVAFAVPILQKWAEDPMGIFAVVLTPTRCGSF